MFFLETVVDIENISLSLLNLLRCVQYKSVHFVYNIDLHSIYEDERIVVIAQAS